MRSCRLGNAGGAEPEINKGTAYVEILAPSSKTLRIVSFCLGLPKFLMLLSLRLLQTLAPGFFLYESVHVN
jgi:hypothetical protein